MLCCLAPADSELPQHPFLAVKAACSWQVTNCSRRQLARNEPLSVPGCIKMAAAVALLRRVVVCCGFRDYSIRRVPADAGGQAGRSPLSRPGCLCFERRAHARRARRFFFISRRTIARASLFVLGVDRDGPSVSSRAPPYSESSGVALCPTQFSGAWAENRP